MNPPLQGARAASVSSAGTREVPRHPEAIVGTMNELRAGHWAENSGFGAEAAIGDVTAVARHASDGVGRSGGEQIEVGTSTANAQVAPMHQTSSGRLPITRHPRIVYLHSENCPDLGEALLSFFEYYGHLSAPLTVHDPLAPHVNLGAKAHQFAEARRHFAEAARALRETKCLSAILIGKP